MQEVVYGAPAAAPTNRGRTTGQFIGDLGAQLLQGAVGLGQAAYGVGNMATLGLLDRGLGLSDNFEQTNQIINTWKSDPTQASLAAGRAAFNEGIGAGVKTYLTDPRLMQDLLVTNLPSILPAAAAARNAALAAGAGTDAAIVASRAGSAAGRIGGVQAGGAANVETINAAHEAGMSDTEAQLAGLGAGVVTGLMTPAVTKVTGAGALEGAVAAKLAGMPGAAAGGFLRSLTGGVVKEGVEEGIQSGAEQAIQNVFTGKPVGEGVAQHAALGSIAGGALGGGFGAYTGLRNNTPQRQDVNQQLQEAAAAAGTTATPGALATPTGQGLLFPDTGGPVQQTVDPRLAGEDVAAFAEASQNAKMARATELQSQIMRVNQLLRDPSLSNDVAYPLRDELAQATTALAELRLPSAVLAAMGVSPQQGLNLRAPNDNIGVTEGDIEHITIGNVEDYDPIMQTGEQLDLIGDPMGFSEEAKGRPVEEEAPPATWLPQGAAQPVPAGQQSIPFDILNFGQAQAQKRANTRAAVAQATAEREAALVPAAARAAELRDAVVAAQVAGAVPPQAGLTEADLLTAKELKKQVQAENEAVVRNMLYTEQDDGSFTQYDVDLQSQQPVAKQDVKKRTREIARAFEEEQRMNPGVTLDEFVRSYGKEATDVVADTAVDAAGVPAVAEGQPVLPAAAGTVEDTVGDAAGVSAVAGEQPAGVQPAATRGRRAKRAADAGAAEPVQPVAAGVDEGVGGQPAAAAEGSVDNDRGPSVKLAAKGKSQLTDVRLVTVGDHTIEIHKVSKDSEDDVWNWRNPENGDYGAFNGGTTKDSAIAAAAGIVEPRTEQWDTHRAMSGESSDLSIGGNRTKFGKAQFTKELNHAMKNADEDETAHGTFLDFVMQSFDAIVATKALQQAKDYAIATAEKRFSTGDDALTPAGLNKLVSNIAAAYNDRHEFIAKQGKSNAKFVDDAVFSRAGGDKAVHEKVSVEHLAEVTEVVRVTNAMRTAREVESTVYATVSDFVADHPEVAVPADAKGVYLTDGSIALIAENLKDRKDAVMTLTHERTHEGLAGLLGDGLSAVTNRVWANAALRGKIKEKMALGLSRDVAAEEVLVDMQEKGERLTGDVLSKIRSGINRGFAAIAGYGDILVDNKDIDALLDDVVKYRTKGASSPTSRLTQDEAMKEVDALLSTGESIATGVRFSRALDDLERLAASDFDSVGASQALSGAAKDSYGYLRGLAASLMKGNLGTLPRHFYKFFSPSQLHSTFSSKWDTEIEGEDGVKRKANAFTDFTGHYSGWADERQRRVHEAGETTKKFDELRRKAPGKARALGSLIQNSTYYQLFPGTDEQPEANGIDPADRARAKEAIDTIWNKLGKEEKALYNQVQEQYRKSYSDLYNAIKDSLLNAKGIDLDTASDEVRKAFWNEFGGKLEAAIHRIKHAPYSPLKRFGNYMVDIKDANGNQVEFTGHDTEAEALKFAADQRARFGSSHVVTTMLRSEFQLKLDGVDSNLIERMKSGVRAIYPVMEIDPTLPPSKRQEIADRNARNAEMQGVVEDVLLDAYLHSVPQHSIMQGANTRRYVAGFPLDAERAFNSHMIANASRLANVKFNGLLTRDLSAMAAHVRAAGEGNDSGISMMNVLNAVRGQYANAKSTDTNALAEKVGQASFIWMMTSPSQVFMNGLQTPLVAAPRMAAQFGLAKTMATLKSSAAQFFTKDGTLNDKSVDPRVREVMNELHQTGTDDFTLAATMAGLAEGDGSDAHTVGRTMMKWASYGLHKSEVFNRQITAHAFAKMYLDKAVSEGRTLADGELLRMTKDFIDNQSHFNYDPHNAPEIMQGPWKKVIWQFQKYRLNMLALLARDIKQAFSNDPGQAKLARRTLAYTVGTQLGLTGAAGTVLSPVVFAIMDAFRDDDDLLDSRTDFLRGQSQIVGHGLLSLAGIDPSRVESGSIIPFLGDRQYAPKGKDGRDVANYYIAKAAGPAAGLATNLWEGSGAIAEGDWKGGAKVLPKPLADAYTTMFFEGPDGARDKKGVKYYEPDAVDIALGVLGVRSASRLEAEEKRGAVYQAEGHVRELSKRALTKVALGYSLGDDDLQREGTEKFMALVSAHPEMVKASDLKRTIVGVAKAQYNADVYGVPKSGALSEEVLGAVGE